MPERIVIQNQQAPGDFVVLSAALRDIQKCHPGRFEIVPDVLQPDVFRHNPYVSMSHKNGARVIQAKYHEGPYPIGGSNRHGAHFMWGMLGYLNQALGTRAVLTEFRPSLHLTEAEKARPPFEINEPYWLFLSGGKSDFTAKIWDYVWWQDLVDMLAPQVKMVQVGGGSHFHPPMKNVFDLVKKTSFRQFMQLIYHSQGVISIVTAAMHVAAAFNKPCVVIAGGREPETWEGYTEKNRLFNMRLGQPGWVPPAGDNFIPHRYLHTIGFLDCCMDGGCWKSKVGKAGKICFNQVKQHGQDLPKCLQLITPDLVRDNWKWYYDNGILRLGAPVTVTVPEIKQRAPETIPVLVEPEPVVEACSTPIPDFKPLVCVSLRAGLGGVDETLARYAKVVHPDAGGVLIVCDGKDLRVEQACKQYGLNLLMGENVSPLELFRKALERCTFEWFIWIEEPITLQRDWLPRMPALLDGKDVLGGLVTWSRVERTEGVEPHPFNPRQGRRWHIAPGLMVATADFLRTVQWNSPDADADHLEVIVSSSSQRQKQRLQDIGTIVESI